MSGFSRTCVVRLKADTPSNLDMEISVECPYCGEPLELYVDVSGGTTQKYVEDCAVCCQPMEVIVEIEGDEEASVSVRRFDD